MYIEHEEVKNRKWFETEKFLDVHQVKFTGFRCPRPLFKYEHANFPDYIFNILKNQENPKPTATQSFCWPVLLSGRDLISVSNSGYGKHLCYMLPILVHIKNQKTHLDKSGPSAMIITPYQPPKDDIYAKTREFIEAAQIDSVFIYDNESKEEQIEKLKSHFDLIVANPIRLLEILDENERLFNLNHINFLAVDEYIQFRKTQTMDYVKKLVDKLRFDRQTAVFSRLVPSGIQRQGDEFVRNCIFFEMHHDKESVNDEIKQIVELCDKYMKASRLVEIVDSLTQTKDCKILIYAKDKEKCLSLNYELKRHLDIEILDFRKDHLFVSTPNCIMTTFKNIGLEINIPDLQYIIQVDFPPNLQTYMDRLRKGIVHYTLFSREDAKHAERLIYSLKQARQEYDPHLFTLAKAWLECGRDMRFMPFIEDIKMGLSKPLQEVMYGSGDEDTTLNSSSSFNSNYYKNDAAFSTSSSITSSAYSTSIATNGFSANPFSSRSFASDRNLDEDFDDDSDEEDDDEYDYK